MLLALACVALLLFFIHHISHAISVNFIGGRIAAETEGVIDEIMPLPRMGHRMADAGPAMPRVGGGGVPSPTSGYIRYIDTKRLVELAKAYRIQVLVLRRVGHFIPEGVPLLQVSKPDRLSPERILELERVFDVGPSRTLQQDIEFGVLQIVDIALKAISPAVNDPTTAINCVDQLSRILIRFTAREAPEGVLYDPPGIVRANILWIEFPQLLHSAFEQIRFYATRDAAVSLRLMRALGDIAICTQDHAFQQALAREGRRILSEYRNDDDQERGELRVRLNTIESLLAPDSPGE